MRELPNMVRVLAAIAVLSGVGCGDDDGEQPNDGGSGARDSGADSGPGGGDEEGSEGWPCTAENECLDDLRCAESPITIGDVSIGVCGAPCSANEECGEGECISYTGESADGHCVNVVDEEFELCGVADTSVCSDDKVCLYLPGAPVGVCVTLCAMGGGGGGEDDAGVSVGECSAEQSCIGGVLADATTGEGVCGTYAERGDTCGVDFGLFCQAGDLCAPEDADDDTSTFRCFQDCTAGTECDEGTCTMVPGLFSYCM